MLSNYRKTKLNSLLFKRSLCAKSNENNKKNIFTFYQLLKLPGRWFRNPTRSNICPAYFTKHYLAGRPHSSAVWDPLSKIITFTSCFQDHKIRSFNWDLGSTGFWFKERKVQREHVTVSFSCQVPHKCGCQGGNFQLPSRLGTSGPQSAINQSGL